MEAQRDAAEEKGKPVTSSVPELHLHLLDADLAEDVVSTYRRREAAWISLATHGIIILLLLFLPKWTGQQAVIVPVKEKPEMIILPDDLSHPKTPPKTPIISDKDRLASTKTPQPDKDLLRKLQEASRRPGAPKPPAPQPQQQAAQQQQVPSPPQPPSPPAQQQPTQQATLEAPKVEQPKTPFAMKAPGTSTSDAINEVAKGHASGKDYGSGGDYGRMLHPNTQRTEGMEILSDTLGVDFGPYMKRLHYTVQDHWDPLIPESARPPMMKKGVVVIQFSIGKDGRVMGMKLVSSSGDVALDRAAWGAITDAIPLPKLPVEFAGEYLELRAIFFYNPDKNDMK